MPAHEIGIQASGLGPGLWHAWCRCGWAGETRKGVNAARRDGNAHLRESGATVAITIHLEAKFATYLLIYAKRHKYRDSAHFLETFLPEYGRDEWLPELGE